MKQCKCGGRLTSYRSVRQGRSMIRYLKCDQCPETDKELLPLGANGKVLITTALPTVGNNILECPCCGHMIKPIGDQKHGYNR